MGLEPLSLAAPHPVGRGIVVADAACVDSPRAAGRERPAYPASPKLNTRVGRSWPFSITPSATRRPLQVA
jgi:hypothetical protein